MSNYKLYRAVLQLRSALATPLHSDTIFGCFCWAVANRHGPDLLKEIIGEVPSIIFSNGFPSGFLPRPILPPMSPSERNDVKKAMKTDDFEAEKKLKQLKKKKFVTKETLLSIKGCLSEQSVVTAILDEGGGVDSPGALTCEEHQRERNIIDRNTGMTLSKGGLFSVSETRYRVIPDYKGKNDVPPQFDLYTLVSEESIFDSNDLMELLRDVFEVNGYGAEASVGAGHFLLSSFDEERHLVMLPEGEALDSNVRVMSLSNFVPDWDSIECSKESLNYSLLSKFGKLGGGWANARNPYKKPLVMMQAGSTFRPLSRMHYFGRMLRSLHNDDACRDVVQNAMLIPFYFKEGGEAQ